ncbi:MAG: PH domain-containing protein [Galactobacter sp.]
MSKPKPSEPQPSESGPAWSRVHPLTPYLKGWAVLLVIIYWVLRNWLDSFIGGDRGPLPSGMGMMWWILGTLVVALVIGVFCYISWRFTRFRLTDSHVQIRSGILFRKELSARLDRIQSVDLNRSLLARIFGLSELRVEVADGGESVLRLAYLPATAAERLRADLLSRAAGARRGVGEAAESGDQPVPSDAAPATGVGAPAPDTSTLGSPAPDAAPAAPPQPTPATGEGQPTPAVGHAVSARTLATRAQEWGRRTGDDLAGTPVYGRFSGGTADELGLVAVAPKRLISWIALTLSPWALLFVVGVVLLGITAPGGAFLGMLIPGLLGLGSAVWQMLNSAWGFRAGVSADGLRVRHGLTETQHRTVPTGRVQAVGISRPWYLRPFGWVCVHADVAGYGGSDQSGSTARSTLLPVGTLTEAARIVSTLIPDAGTENPWELLEEGVDGREGGFVSSPRSSRWISPIGWKRQGFRVTDTTLVLRGGRINRRLALIPHARVQAVRSYQGPVSRSLGLAKVRFCTVAGPVSTVLPDVSAPVASRLIVEQSARTIAAAQLEGQK